jgi:hypothetical protein
MATARAMLERRRASRVFLSIPISVSTKTPQNEELHAPAIATALSRCGALLRVPFSTALDSRVHIVHGHSQETREARVVRVSDCQDDGSYELGVELFHPGHNFWGVRFPDEQYFR